VLVEQPDRVIAAVTDFIGDTRVNSQSHHVQGSLP
jgi:hypothetical protein